MKTLDIQNSLDAHLKTLAELPLLQTENTRINASPNLNSFTRSTLLPAQSSVLAIGAGAPKQMTGLYQVDVFVPSDSGTATARGLADSIVDIFPAGLLLTSGNSTVHIDIASVMAAYTINKYYCIPVRVQWNTYGQ